MVILTSKYWFKNVLNLLMDISKHVSPMWKIHGRIPSLSSLYKLISVDFVKPSEQFNFLDSVGVIITWIYSKT